MTPNQPISLNCPACGAPLDCDGSCAIARCKFCGNVSVVPGIQPAQTAAPSSTLDEIRKMAQGGNIAGAEERFRQTYNVDPQEAQDAIHALQAGRLVTPSASGMRPSEELIKALQEVQRLLADGKKAEAISVYRQNYDVSMARAQYAIEQIAAGQTVRPESGFQAKKVAFEASSDSSETSSESDETSPDSREETPTPSRPGGHRGIAVFISVLFFALFAGGFYLAWTGGVFTTHYDAETPAVLIPTGSEAVGKIASLFYDSNADDHFIGLVDIATGKLLWQTAPLSGEGYIDAIASGADMIYAANGTDLLAYRQSNGSLAWRALMPDTVNALLVSAGRVITNNIDHSIQAYDAETGNLVWDKQLTAGDPALRLLGNSLTVIDYTDIDRDTGLEFLNPTTGSQPNVIIPSCIKDGDTSNMNTDSGLVYDPADNSLFLLFDSCVKRLDLAHGKTVWNAAGMEGFEYSSEDFQSLLTNASLYFNNGNDLLAVDKSTGAMEVLLTDPNYKLLPLAMAGNKLIVRAQRTHGTGRYELWGVDSTSGSQVWHMDLNGYSPIDPPNAMDGTIDDSSSGGWTWKLVPGGLVIIKFQANPNQLVLETYNPADGTRQSTQTIALSKVDGDYYDVPAIISWQGSVVYLSLGSNIYSLDIENGDLKVIY